MTTEIVQHEYCKKTLQMEEGARLLYLMLGERLYNIRNNKLYEPFWDSWNTFCMEFKDLSPSAISKIIKVYEIFVQKFGFSPEKLVKAGGWTKLYEIATIAKDKESAQEWIEKAETSSRQDLGKFIVEAKTSVDMSECKHDNHYVIKICRDCGSRESVYDTKTK